MLYYEKHNVITLVKAAYPPWHSPLSLTAKPGWHWPFLHFVDVLMAPWSLYFSDQFHKVTWHVRSPEQLEHLVKLRKKMSRLPPPMKITHLAVLGQFGCSWQFLEVLFFIVCIMYPDMGKVQNNLRLSNNH